MNTPRTDALIDQDDMLGKCPAALTDLCRELERSLSEETRKRETAEADNRFNINRCDNWMGKARQAEAERDRALANADMTENARLILLGDVRALNRRIDDLVERSMGALCIAEGREGHEAIPRDCPTLDAVSRLREYAEQLKQGRENGAAPAAPKFGCGASRTALADDLRARGDELSLEAADFIDCAHRKQQRLVWWPDGRPALRTEYHDGGWSEHAIDAEPKAVLGVWHPVPDGWKLVPIEATKDQLYAAGVAPKNLDELEPNPGEPDYVPVTRIIYRQMIAAAPEPAAPSQFNSEPKP